MLALKLTAFRETQAFRPHNSSSANYFNGKSTFDFLYTISPILYRIYISQITLWRSTESTAKFKQPISMKTIFLAFLIAVAFSSCQADTETETADAGTSQTAVEASETRSGHLTQAGDENDAIQQKSGSLIGKTTVELESMGWFSCAGRLLGPNLDEGALWISQIAGSQGECRNGAGKILLERFVSRDGNKVLHEVIDEINIASNYPEREYNWTTCNIQGSDGEQFFVIHFKDQRQAELTEIHDLWAIDVQAGRFIKVEGAKNVTCVNPDYSDGL
jgi:hypothetical protein